MATFAPDTYEVPIPTSVRPVRYYRFTEASSVVRVNGTLTVVKSPSGDLLTGTEGVDYFLGGRRYAITSATRDELNAAGFFPNWLADTWSNAGFGPGTLAQPDLHTLILTSLDPGIEFAVRQVNLPVVSGIWGLRGRVYRPAEGLTSPYIDVGGGPTFENFPVGWTDLASLGTFTLASAQSTVTLGGSRGAAVVFQDIKLVRIDQDSNGYGLGSYGYGLYGS